MPNDHTILSLDLGNNLGWAKVVNGVIVQSGVVSLFRKDAHPGDRFLRFSNWLRTHKGLNEIFYEDVPRFESNFAARVYCGLLSQLQIFCLVSQVRLTNIKANSVKKEFTGNGRADKIEICRTAHRLGWKHGHLDLDLDHDEADALACAWVILKRRNIEPELAA
jgi:hypothetical protein